MVGIIRGTSENPAMIKYGMIGGGPDAFFGSVHRKAAAMDGEIDLEAGISIICDKLWIHNNLMV